MTKNSTQGKKSDDIKPRKEKLLQAKKKKTGSRSEQEFKKNAVERKYSKEAPSNDSANQESLRDEEKTLNNEGSEKI